MNIKKIKLELIRFNLLNLLSKLWNKNNLIKNKLKYITKFNYKLINIIG